jgi:hypothetical protein
MAKSTKRPRTGAPPALDEPKDILLELLDAERARLKVALRIEEERKIVFPETSIIIRDIQKLIVAIYGKSESPEVAENTKSELKFEPPKFN